MPSSDLKSLGVSQDEVKAALAREQRPGVRCRLVAIGKILDGTTIKQAAQAAKATRGSVERWLKRVRQAGLEGLLLDKRRRYRKREMTAGQRKDTRQQIATALTRALRPQVRARLMAIDAVLSGQPIDEVAAGGRVLPNAVKTWLRAVTYAGIGPTLARWEGRDKPRPRQLDADPAALRGFAAKEKNPRVRKRMLALARVAEGMSPLDAAVSVGLQHSTVLKRMKRFREEGIATFQDRKIAGRPYRLDGTQFQELRDEVLLCPGMSYPRLRDLIWARFHVQYSRASLPRLLRKRLGIIRRGRTFLSSWVELRKASKLYSDATTPQATLGAVKETEEKTALEKGANRSE